MTASEVWSPVWYFIVLLSGGSWLLIDNGVEVCFICSQLQDKFYGVFTSQGEV